MKRSFFQPLAAAGALAVCGAAASADLFVPFTDLCEPGGCMGTLTMASLVGPEPGTVVTGVTIEVTWTTDGFRDASALGILLEFNVDGTRRSFYVTGTGLGFTAPGPGTFHGIITTDAFNGVVDAGFLPGFPAVMDAELMPDPTCEAPPYEHICGTWGSFETNASGTPSGITFHTGAAPLCPVDWNGDGGVDVFDLLAYLDDWFSANARAELDGTDGITVFDLLAFLNGWFDVTNGAPCP